mgnify:CR=1 FL=1
MKKYKNFLYGAMIMLVVYVVLLMLGISFKMVFIATSIISSVKVIALESTIEEMRAKYE